MGLLVSLLSLMTVAAVGIWGYLLVRFIQPSGIDKDDYGLWVIGPCFGFGSLALYFLRLLVPGSIFIILFFSIPLTFTAVLTARQINPRSALKGIRLTFQQTLLYFLAFVGLTGLNLGDFWIWAVPIALFALLLAIIFPHNVRKLGGLLTGLLALLSFVLIAWSVTRQRPETWWLSVEQIPADEALLEAYSNALIEFGPGLNPLWSGLSAASAFSYHNLAYLVVGLINKIAEPAPYVALVNAAPSIISLNLVASLILLVRHISGRTRQLIKLNGFGLIALVACLLVLRISNHPSTMLGYSSLIASFVIIQQATVSTSHWRNILLVCISVIVVAFSKGPFIVGTVVAAVSISLFGGKRRWGVGTFAMLTCLLTSAFFSLASDAASSVRFEFWSPYHMTSVFGLNLYNLNIFFSLLILPIITGVAASFAIPLMAGSELRKWSVSMVMVMAVSVISQMFLASDATKGHTYFYRSAIVATGIAILLLSLAAARQYELSGLKLCLGIGLSITAYYSSSRVSDALGYSSIKPLALVSGLAVLIAIGGYCASQLRKQSNVRHLALMSAALLLSSSTIVDYSERDLDGIRSLRVTNADRSWDNWLGDADMVELIGFIKRETRSSDLIAQSNCDLSLFTGDRCEPDFRLAALTGRRFLASDPMFYESYVNIVTWSDVILSSKVGSEPPSETLRDFQSRGVTYLILHKSRVPATWRDQARNSSATVVFENNSFELLRLL
jgi:hypothetical protein